MHALLLHDQQRRNDDAVGPGATLPIYDDENEFETYRQEAKLQNSKTFSTCFKNNFRDGDLFVEMYCRIRILESKLTSHPAEEFQNRAIYKKIEGVYMEHYNAVDRRKVSEAFRPIFIRPTQEGIRVNGEVDEQMEDPVYAQEMHKKDQKSWRNYVFDVMHNENTDALSTLIYIVIVLAIIVSVFATIFSTIEKLAPYQQEWDIIEAVVTILFTVEYTIRVLVVRNRFAYVTRLMNVLDLLAISPWYYKLVVGGNSSLGGVMRALRLSRIAKIRQIANPYTNILMESLSQTIAGTGSSLGIFLFICSVVTGTIVYEVEKLDNFEQFYNIPISMWFSVVTLTTVGYGDMSPVTTLGYILGTATILVGVLLSSLIIMVVGQYYIDLLNEYQEEVKRIKEDLFDYYGKKRYKGAIMNQSIDILYNAVKETMEIRTEDMEDDSTDDEGDYEPISPTSKEGEARFTGKHIS